MKDDGSTAYKIYVMHAHECGLVIQDDIHLGWLDNRNPCWDWPRVNYRVKPKETKKVIEHTFTNVLSLDQRWELGRLTVIIEVEENEM